MAAGFLAWLLLWRAMPAGWRGRLPALVVLAPLTLLAAAGIEYAWFALATNLPAERILLLTFTRRAAHEMLSRAERLVGSASHRVHGGTFHATAHRLLRRFGPAAGLAADFTIMDQGDAEDLMQLSRAALGLGEGNKGPGGRRVGP